MILVTLVQSPQMPLNCLKAKIKTISEWRRKPVAIPDGSMWLAAKQLRMSLFMRCFRHTLSGHGVNQPGHAQFVDPVFLHKDEVRTFTLSSSEQFKILIASGAVRAPTDRRQWITNNLR
jgi:hypothetical protein